MDDLEFRRRLLADPKTRILSCLMPSVAQPQTRALLQS